MRKIIVAVAGSWVLALCGCADGREAQQGMTPAASKEGAQEAAGREPVPVKETEGKDARTAGTQEGKEAMQDSVRKGAQDDEVGVLETKFGKMVIEFYPQLAPKTVARIKELVKKRFYDGLVFHRVVPGFCIQGGDPAGTGAGGTGVKVPGEFSKEPFVDGCVGMARSADPNSNDCQFFITLGRAGNLDNNYTLFGKVIEGLEVAHAIEKVPCEGPAHAPRPKQPVTITSFRLEERGQGK